MKFSIGLLVLLGLTFIPHSSVAKLLSFSGPSVKEISKIAIAPKAEVENPWENNKKVPLYLTGAGERIKKVLFVKVHAYVIASYLDQPKKLVPSERLKAIDSSAVKALHLTFLRDISADKIRSSFEDSLEANGAELKSEPIRKLLNEFDTEVKENQTLDVVAFSKAEGKDTLLVDLAHKHFSVEGTKLASAFWKIWYGKPADGGLEDLKETLLSQIGRLP